MRLIATWLALLVATAVSWAVGQGATTFPPNVAGATILIVAFIKIRLVMFEFMELRHAPMVMRIGCECWVIGVCSGLLFLYQP